jgi:hypothetical protein
MPGKPPTARGNEAVQQVWPLTWVNAPPLSFANYEKREVEDLPVPEQRENFSGSGSTAPTHRDLGGLPSGYRMAFRGFIVAVINSVVCFFVATGIITLLDWRLHPDISGSTIYFVAVYFFALIYIPVLFLIMFVLVLPLTYIWFRDRAAPVPLIGTTLSFLAIEAIYITFFMLGMESFGTLFAIYMVPIGICTVAALPLLFASSNAMIGPKRRNA